MDVTCQRCQTRYEFDDALVSSRGTTVKCTQCGNLFKVRPPAGSAAQDAWIVRTTNGEELTFKAMRELQAAITSGRVGRDDELVGEGRNRLLGEIDELEIFFPDGDTLEPDTVRQPRKGSTRIGVAAPAVRPGRTDRDGKPLPTRSGTTLRPPPSPKAEQQTAPFVVSRGRQADGGPSDPSPIRSDSAEPTTRKRRSDRPAALPLPPTDDMPDEGRHEAARAPEPKPSSSTGEAVLAMQRAVSAALADEGESEPASEGEQLVRAAREPGPADEETYDEQPRELPGTVRVSDMPGTVSYPPSDSSETASLPPMTPSASVARPSILGRTSAFTDPRFSSFESPTKQPSFARWLIGLVVLGVVAVVGFTLLKRYLPAGEPAAAGPQEDERVNRFLREGRERLAAGDVEGAREQFIMASGVAETDPRVSRSLALIEVIRADVVWLELRLLTEDDPERERVSRSLEEAVSRAEKATNTAERHAPRNRASIRLRIDVLRLKGEREAARNMVAQLGEPATADAVALAALDLSEESPSWVSVIDRLRTAAREERKLGRARSMLVYALARAGKKNSAASELSAFSAATPNHPLLTALRRFVDGSEASEDDVDGGADAIDGGDGESESEDALPGDFREAIRKAHTARRAGNLDRAEKLYHAALEKSPGNSEALAGLAEVYRGRGDTAAAITAYESLLRQNPGYLPGLVGLADMKWQAGSRAQAVSLYRQVIEASPGSSYAAHAERRIKAAEGSSSAAKPPPPSGTEPPSEPGATTQPAKPPTDSTSDLPPGVDVSDLPEYQQ